MRDLILNLFENGKTLSFQDIVLHIFLAAVIGLVIYISYWISHTGTVYSKKFNVSLIMLTVLTATVMVVIGNNVALSLGMVGALSIVRYRTAIKDSRDTAYIFWAIISGICCGAGDYTIGAVGTSVVFLILLFLGRVKNDNRILVVIKGDRDLERAIESVVFTSFDKRAKLRVKNSTNESIELIYEVSKKIYDKNQLDAQSFIEKIYNLGTVEYVNIVAQNDEIV
ncbi:DUF4956 domain-containing protein [Oscillospiraceae bacterium PP1C4]